MTEAKFKPGDVLIQAFSYPYGMSNGPAPDRVFFDIMDRTGLIRPQWVRVTVVVGINNMPTRWALVGRDQKSFHDELWYNTLLLKSNIIISERAKHVDKAAIKLHDTAEIFGINIVKFLRQEWLKIQLTDIVEK